MTKYEAVSNIGQPFKVIGMGKSFDVIRKVDPDGTVHGDFTEANCQDCRLKQEQPEHLKKHKESGEDFNSMEEQRFDREAEELEEWETRKPKQKT